eukprot:1550881-Pleurochrysis_carterae.AAC.3
MYATDFLYGNHMTLITLADLLKKVISLFTKDNIHEFSLGDLIDEETDTYGLQRLYLAYFEREEHFCCILPHASGE